MDLESFELQEERPKKRRRRSVKKVAKQDIRRHFSKVFISAVNSNGGKTIETFFNTFMKHGCKVHLEVPNKEQQEEEVTLVAEGPYKSSFFALGLGIMYPDMILSENSCQLFTSNIWNGTKIVLNFKFVGTPIFCLSLPRAVELMNSLYVNDVDNTSQSSFSYNSQSDNGSESGNSSLASEAGSKSSKKSRRESTTSTTLGADSPLTAKVRAMFHQVPLLVDPKEISLLWTMTIILDPHNMMEQVHVALSDEQV